MLSKTQPEGTLSLGKDCDPKAQYPRMPTMEGEGRSSGECLWGARHHARPLILSTTSQVGLMTLFTNKDTDASRNSHK